MSQKEKCVDLAALSMSGSLMPSIPVQIMLKYDPPKMTIVYHFEKKDKEKFYHDIFIEKRMLEHMNDEDICSHLYVTESYYFNPKQIKRPQVLRLIKKLKEGLEIRKQNLQQQEQQNKQQQQQLQNQQQQKAQQQPVQQQKEQAKEEKPKSQEQLEQEQKRKNFLQKRRLVNYEIPADYSDDEEEVNKQKEQKAAAKFNQQTNNNHQVFDDDPIIKNRAPSHSPQQQQEVRKPMKSKLPPLESQNVKSQGYDIQNSNKPGQQAHVPSIKEHDLLNFEIDDETHPFEYSPPQNIAQKRSGGSREYDDLIDMVGFDSDNDVKHQQQPQPQQPNGQVFQNKSLQSQTYSNNEPYNLDQNNSQHQIEGFELDNNNNNPLQEGNEGDEEEEESVYIKDNIVMRRIQIEGEENEYLMDPDGNIYDMQGTFIGTANANELEEAESDDQQLQQSDLMIPQK